MKQKKKAQNENCRSEKCYGKKVEKITKKMKPNVKEEKQDKINKAKRKCTKNLENLKQPL